VTKRRNLWDDGDAPRLSESPIEDEAVRQQLAQLFGESLFGPWPQLQQDAGKLQQRRPSKRWLFRLSVLLTLGAVTFGVHSLVKPGLKHQVEDQRENYAQELKTFIDDGNLESAAQFVPIVEGHPETGQPRDIDPKDPHLDLIVAAEAALYRYFDGSPERLRRIRPYLNVRGQPSPLRQIANLTILSREERAARLTELEKLRNDLPDKNELEYMLATALEYRGDAQSSREAWERTAKLEPAWLGHRFEQAWFELRQHQAPAAQQIARQMLQIDPDSAWSKLAGTIFAVPKDFVVTSIRGDAATPAASPVQIHFERLLQGIIAARRNDFNQAQQLLGEAAAAIQYQAPFLFDAFDWCIAENELALARVLADMPKWPRDSAFANAKLQRLSAKPPNPQKESPSAAAQPSSPTASPSKNAPTQTRLSPRRGKLPANRHPSK
jgi:hypothetical protein